MKQSLREALRNRGGAASIVASCPEGDRRIQKTRSSWFDFDAFSPSSLQSVMGRFKADDLPKEIKTTDSSMDAEASSFASFSASKATAWLNRFSEPAITAAKAAAVAASFVSEPAPPKVEGGMAAAFRARGGVQDSEPVSEPERGAANLRGLAPMCRSLGSPATALAPVSEDHSIMATPRESGTGNVSEVSTEMAESEAPASGDSQAAVEDARCHEAEERARQAEAKLKELEARALEAERRAAALEKEAEAAPSLDGSVSVIPENDQGDCTVSTDCVPTLPRSSTKASELAENSSDADTSVACKATPHCDGDSEEKGRTFESDLTSANEVPRTEPSSATRETLTEEDAAHAALLAEVERLRRETAEAQAARNRALEQHERERKSWQRGAPPPATLRLPSSVSERKAMLGFSESQKPQTPTNETGEAKSGDLAAPAGRRLSRNMQWPPNESADAKAGGAAQMPQKVSNMREFWDQKSAPSAGDCKNLTKKTIAATAS